MSHRLGILSAWTGSGVGALDVLSKKAGWWEVSRGAIWRESHRIIYAGPGLRRFSEVEFSVPLPGAHAQCQQH